MSAPYQLTIIVAMAKNGVIGLNNKLPWHLPDDLRRFRRLTMGHTIIMGRKTYDSLPQKPLPGRNNIVLSRRSLQLPPQVKQLHTIEDVLKLAENQLIYVIGGGDVYRQLFPYASKLEITMVDKTLEGDTFFPPINDDDWVTLSEEPFLDKSSNISGCYKSMLRKPKSV